MAWKSKHPEEWSFEETEDFLEETYDVLDEVNENLPEYEVSAGYDEKIDNVLSQLDSIQSIAEMNALSVERVEALAEDNYEDAQELYEDFLNLREAVHERDNLDHRMLDEVNSSLRSINSALEDVPENDGGYNITRREAAAGIGGVLAAAFGGSFVAGFLDEENGTEQINNTTVYVNKSNPEPIEGEIPLNQGLTYIQAAPYLTDEQESTVQSEIVDERGYNKSNLSVRFSEESEGVYDTHIYSGDDQIATFDDESLNIPQEVQK